MSVGRRGVLERSTMRNFAAGVAVLLAFTSAVNAFQVTRAPRAPVRPRIGGVGQLQPARPPGLSLRAKALAAAAAPESVPEGEELVAAGGSGATAVVCDPYNPRLCDPIEIPKEQQKKFDLKRFVKLTTLFGIWFVSFRFVSFRFVGFDAGHPLVSGTSFWGIRTNFSLIDQVHPEHRLQHRQ
jgi:hypothetical protein